MTITIDKQGRRFYLRGDTYAVRGQIRAAGAKWDADTRCWYTGVKATADAIVERMSGATTTAERPSESLTPSSEIIGKATYKGREYLLIWEGNTRRGPAAKLAFADGSKVFWASQGEYAVSKHYERPITLAKLNRLREEYKSQREEPALTGERTDIIVQFTASRSDRKPADRIGDTKWIKHRGERIACTLVGYEAASFVRGEDAEDMGHYGVRDGWYGIAYYQPTTEAEQAAMEMREAPAREAQRAREARAKVETWLTAQLTWDAPGVEHVTDTGKLPTSAETEISVVVGRKTGASGTITDGGTTYALTATSVVAHHGGYYDDYRSSTRTIARTDELAQVIRALSGGDTETISVLADRIQVAS